MKTRKLMRTQRRKRIRASISGTADRPRIAVFRSGTSMEVQFIDDLAGRTILSKHLRGKNIQAARELGVDLATLAKKKKISKVVFDRGGFRFHGAIKSLADALREGGIQF